MFRDMRRIKQQLSDQETVEIFEKGTSGTLALLGDDDYPYSLPISYVYADGKFYFHCAKAGHKIDAIMKSSKASFSVIAQDLIGPEKFTTYFKSAIAFGKIRILETEEEILSAIRVLSAKYNSDDKAGMEREINSNYASLCMLELTVEHMTGKQSIELVD